MPRHHLPSQPRGSLPEEWRRIKSGGRRGYWRRRLEGGRYLTARPVTRAGQPAWRWMLRGPEWDGTTGAYLVHAQGFEETAHAARWAADLAADGVSA